jgi:hypothetical protein
MRSPWGGHRFHPWHVLGEFMAPKHVKKMLAGLGKYYYTGGTQGQSVFMLDEDAHQPWQDDLGRAFVPSYGPGRSYNPGPTGFTWPSLVWPPAPFRGCCQASERGAAKCKILVSLAAEYRPVRASKYNKAVSSRWVFVKRQSLAGRVTYSRCIDSRCPYFNGAALFILTHQFPFMHDAAALLTFPGRPTVASGPRNRPATVGGPPTEDGWEGHRDRPVPLQFRLMGQSRWRGAGFLGFCSP